MNIERKILLTTAAAIYLGGIAAATAAVAHGNPDDYLAPPTNVPSLWMNSTASASAGSWLPNDMNSGQEMGSLQPSGYATISRGA